MGLPSGLLWASCNVGAEKPSDLGLFFSWGNIVGHSISEEYDFSEDAYNSSPAASIDTDLSLNQDAARLNLGAPWRMPTADEFRELYDNCTNVWDTINGVDGIIFTSNVNGNSLFFPAAGIFVGKSLTDRGTRGYYWSSSFVSETTARGLQINGSNVNPQYNGTRRRGISVRAVMQPT